MKNLALAKVFHDLTHQSQTKQETRTIPLTCAIFSVNLLLTNSEFRIYFHQNYHTKKTSLSGILNY